MLVDDVTLALSGWPPISRCGGPLLGVTGSAGKTTTKDLVAAVLATAAPTLKTEGNLNNHWGVPLTLLGLRPEHRTAVVEMAMSAAGEIAQLAAIARPDAGVITNAGSAHLGGEGLGSVAARRKAALAAALPAGRPLLRVPTRRSCQRAIGNEVPHDPLWARARPGVTPLEELGPEGCSSRSRIPAGHLRLIGRQNALAAIAVAREFR